MAGLRKKMLLIAAISSLLLILSACGDKSQEGAVKKITEKAEEINGYKAKMEMTMKTGEKDQSYDVNAWYKQGRRIFTGLAWIIKMRKADKLS